MQKTMYSLYKFPNGFHLDKINFKKEVSDHNEFSKIFITEKEQVILHSTSSYEEDIMKTLKMTHPRSFELFQLSTEMMVKIFSNFVFNPLTNRFQVAFYNQDTTDYTEFNRFQLLMGKLFEEGLSDGEDLELVKLFDFLLSYGEVVENFTIFIPYQIGDLVYEYGCVIKPTSISFTNQSDEAFQQLSNELKDDTLKRAYVELVRALYPDSFFDIEAKVISLQLL